MASVIGIPQYGSLIGPLLSIFVRFHWGSSGKEGPTLLTGGITAVRTILSVRYPFSISHFPLAIDKPKSIAITSGSEWGRVYHVFFFIPKLWQVSRQEWKCICVWPTGTFGSTEIIQMIGNFSLEFSIE